MLPSIRGSPPMLSLSPRANGDPSETKVKALAEVISPRVSEDASHHATAVVDQNNLSLHERGYFRRASHRRGDAELLPA